MSSALNENTLAGTPHSSEAPGLQSWPSTKSKDLDDVIWLVRLRLAEVGPNTGWISCLLPFPQISRLQRQLPTLGPCDRKENHYARPCGMLCLPLIFPSASRPESFWKKDCKELLAICPNPEGTDLFLCVSADFSASKTEGHKGHFNQIV